MDSLSTSKRRRSEGDRKSVNMQRSGSLTAKSHPNGDSRDTISKLASSGKWDEVVHRVLQCPQEIINAPNPSPLAIACRTGAPYECIKTLLDADPRRVRYLLDSRGTPLHEAIVCEASGSIVIRALLKADEALGNDSIRATLQQDVDGFVPLHLLIRRRFQSHILSLDEDMSLMEILEMLVSSCPEAVTIPDRGEYEEPPIVYALKANIYAPSLGSEEGTLARVERQIYEMVQTMLKYAPNAASRVFSGFRGQYTALHSAVFHGRYTTTIDLILKTEALFPQPQQAALLANTQGELPLHFCAMRGERPRTVALLAKAAPSAVLYRDASGLTPFHWLWIRFISTLMAMDEDGRGFTVQISANKSAPGDNKYNEFTLIEQGDFDIDLPLIRRLDPPVDFLRMRHIPMEVAFDVAILDWCDRSVDILQRIRERHYIFKGDTDTDSITWTRQETVISLFWTKVVSLLEAAGQSMSESPSVESFLVHTAFATPCCLPSVAYLVASLFPSELATRDSYGRLPIHCAAARPWTFWDWPRSEGAYEHPAQRLLAHETLDVLRVALRLSNRLAARVADSDNRLALHLVVDTFVNACTLATRSTKVGVMTAMLQILHDLLRLFPESLQRRDGVTKLYPFQQAAATASSIQTDACIHEELHLTISYELLRENPSLVNA